MELLVLVQHLLTEENWFYMIVTEQVMLMSANFALAVCFYWIYYRTPELRKYWGPAGALSVVFGCLFFAKGVERVCMTVALFHSFWWNFAVIVDTVIAALASIAAVSLFYAILNINGVRMLLVERGHMPPPGRHKE